nr:DUF5610 domain-containing protein [Pseudomaricurvus alkylphenolicus]
MLSERYQSVRSSFSLVQNGNTGIADNTGVEASDAVQEPSTGALKASGNILSFIEAQLKRDLADGADAEALASRLEAGLEGFKKGFGEAAEQLEEMGLLSEEMEAEIGQTYDLVLAGVEKLRERFVEGISSGADNDGAQAAAPVANVDMPAPASIEQSFGRYESAQRNEFSFSLTTADGDRVTISASSLRASITQQYAAQVQGLETLLQYQRSSTAEDRFAFTVEGELDADELEAINELLGQVNDLAATFYSGDVEAAFEEALELGYDSSEITAFSLNMTQTSVQRVTEVYERVGQGNRADGLAGRLAPLGNFVRELMDAQQTASRFGQPLELLSALLEGVDASAGSRLQNFVERLSEGFSRAA